MAAGQDFQGNLLFRRTDRTIKSTDPVSWAKHSNDLELIFAGHRTGGCMWMYLAIWKVPFFGWIRVMLSDPFKG